MTARAELPLLDVMVAWACQLKCTACTNLMALQPQEIFPTSDIKADITRAAEIMHTEVAVLLGGEPLVHRDLVDLMRFTASSGLADRVRVLTNGIRLHKMTDEFWAELQDLKVSIYPGKTQPENIELAKRMQAEHRFELSFYDVAADPFKAVHTLEPRSSDDAARVYRGCWYRTFTRKIERGFFWRCCTSPSISQTLMGLPPEADGLELATATTESVNEFLHQQHSANACTRCHGHTGPSLQQWSEQRDKSRWLVDSAR